MFEKIASIIFSEEADCGIMRSAARWESLLGKKALESLVKLEALQSVRDSRINGFSDLFSFGEGVQRYTLEIDEGTWRAIPEELSSSHTVLKPQDNLVYTSSPRRLLEIIAEKNGFSVDRNLKLPSSSVVASRSLVRNQQAILVSLSDSSAQRSLDALTSKYPNAQLFIFTPSGQVRSHHRPNCLALSFSCIDDLGRFPRNIFLDHTSATLSDAVGLYPEIKVWVDRKVGEIYLLGQKLPVPKDGREYLYVVGLCERPGASFTREDFTTRALRYKNFEHRDGRIKDARNDLSARFNKMFSGSDELLTAAQQMFTQFDRTHVHANFKESDVIFWGETSLPA